MNENNTNNTNNFSNQENTNNDNSTLGGWHTPQSNSIPPETTSQPNTYQNESTEQNSFAEFAGYDQDIITNPPTYQSHSYNDYDNNHNNITSDAIETSDNSYSYDDYYYTHPANLVPSHIVAEPKKRKIKGRFVALSVSLALIFGIVGSCFTYYFVSKNADNSDGQNTSLNTVSNDEDEDSSSGEKEVADNISSKNFTAGDIAAIAQKASPSVVEIATEVVTYNRFMGQYVTNGAGSGVVYSEDGYIITNYHVIEGASSILVRTSDGKEYTAKLVGSDSKNDIAVLKIDATGLTKAEIADSDKVSVGELAVAIGNPLGTLGGTVTEGIISAKDREIQLDENVVLTLLQTSAAVNPGNSGGGLFNGNGQLVGIVTAKSSGTGVEGLGFAIPSNLAEKIAKTIIETGSIDKEVANNDSGQGSGDNSSEVYDFFSGRGE